MAEPRYVSIAGEIARRIRTGALPPRTKLGSYSELAEEHEVSEIVIRRAVELLLSQGLVRTVERRGTYVADRPNLVRVSPERQMESPEMTYRHESDADVTIEKEVSRVLATEEVAEALGVRSGDEVTYTVTRATEGKRPVSISDTFQPLDVEDTSGASYLEETVADRIPPAAHADFLRTPPGDLVKSVHQRFITKDNRVVMVSDVSYPRDRYDAFVFRMHINDEPDSYMT
ncbi:GntR family transcriptional regulator [Nocardia sp. NRRL WC-3656]|uniref:GntR family transcriptional regulator n=1 Tax=Nocardia sp. NRRL WC-3656 TaxID=1463824 RepID=UPI0004C41D0B|nr:GntR family transcriptional regulator [Nocardia sp. NRRL WC-3656]